jgi:hypothetical protein
VRIRLKNAEWPPRKGLARPDHLFLTSKAAVSARSGARPACWGPRIVGDLIPAAFCPTLVEVVAANWRCFNQAPHCNLDPTAAASDLHSQATATVPSVVNRPLSCQQHSQLSRRHPTLPAPGLSQVHTPWRTNRSCA